MPVRLRGITWDHPRGFDPLVATANKYANETDDQITISWEKRSLQAFADQSLVELASNYDLIVIDHPHVGVAAQSKCLLPLNSCGKDAELNILSQQSVGASFASYFYDDHMWALPIDAATQIAAYRPDLIDESEIPSTWDQVLELAKQNRVLWPLKPVDAMCSFNSLAANLGSPIGQCGKLGPFIDEQAGQTVLAAMQEIACHLPSACLRLDPPALLDWMSRSNNQQYAYCPLLYGYTNYSRPAFADRLIHFTNIPTLGTNGPIGTQLGGTGLAISAACANPSVALDYAFWLASADCQRTIYTAANGQPANSVAWDDDACNAITHNFFRDTRMTIDGAWVRPRYEGYLTVQDQGGDTLNRFLHERRDISTTLEELNVIWNNMP